MKIGILTFHSQTNYGGVLQTYAMQTALEEMGHEAVVLDRWISENNHPLQSFFSLKLSEQIIMALHCIAGTGMFANLLRCRRTRNFIASYLQLSHFHFREWSDLPAESYCDLDCILVGSDQVWHIFGGKFPGVYFLENMSGVPAISYAASIGMKEIPASFHKRVLADLKKFHALSVREKTAQQLLFSLGLDVEHVVDPTLLASESIWQFFSGRKSRKRLFCYFMEDDLLDIYPVLSNYATESGSIVDIFLNEPYVVRFPNSLDRIRKLLKYGGLRFFGNKRVRLHNDAGPAEFVYYASLATDAVSDSFHALMFSIIFDLNIRILRPEKEVRIFMFSRIEEFSECVAQGTLISDGLQAALHSILHDPPVIFDSKKIEEKRKHSSAWLQNVLGSLHAGI